MKRGFFSRDHVFLGLRRFPAHTRRMLSACLRFLLFASVALGAEDEPKATAAAPEALNLEEMTTQAAAAFSSGNVAEARVLFQRLLENNPKNSLALANLGTLEDKAGRPEKAADYLERALTIDPHLAQTWMQLGLIFFEQKSYYRALSALSRAVHEDPRDARPHNYLGITAQAMGWSDAAESELQRAIELDAQYGAAYFNLALVYLDRQPVPAELVRQNYEKARGLGIERNKLVEERLAEPVASSEPPPVSKAVPVKEEKKPKKK